MNSARRRAVRAVLTALAGGGLTAASLGVAVPGTALAAGTTTTTEGTQTTGTATTEAAQPASTVTTSTTTTSTTPETATAPTATTTAPAPAPAAPEVPTVVLQKRQKKTTAVKHKLAEKTESTTAKAKSLTGNNVALSPQQIAAQASALASTEASIQALGFYRIPLFLLPVYKAAAVQYGVPWQILAAINEIETDYGTDLSVSSAGAVGWMQFMPATWLQYGVDALNAGYADPYNPVDAIFAAARYLRAAGAATDLHAAILAYNHSEEYASSVLLRAKLISSYPKAVIATLTGLIDGRLPVTGTQVAWSALPASTFASASSATGNATAVTGEASSASAAGSAPATNPQAADTAGSSAQATGQAASSAGPGTAPAVSPTAAVAAAAKRSGASAPLQLVQLTSGADAKVVAVQDGRIMKIGYTAALGKYVILRDVYGDVFTYAGFGSIARTYTLPRPQSRPSSSPVVEVAASKAPAPSQAASAGFQSPLTLTVKTRKAAPSQLLSSGQATVPAAANEATPAGMGRIRLFAHPGNPDARAAAVAASAARASEQKAAQRLQLRRGAVVAAGTVLGTMSVTPNSTVGHLRFAIKPAGDVATVAPGPVLANWAELQASLHPQGAKAEDPLLGATASDVFLLSQAQLQRTVLSDPGITIYACGRQDISAGLIDKRVLAVLAFLSRSGLKPTVSALRCGQDAVTASGASSAAYRGDEVEITAINGTPIAGHQGAGTITDLTLRTLLTLPAEFIPGSLLSLMRYPGSSNTHASSAYWNKIALQFSPKAPKVAVSPAAAAAGVHSAHSGKDAPAPLITTSSLSSSEWDQLITRIAEIPAPGVRRKPSSAAIPDPKRP